LPLPFTFPLSAEEEEEEDPTAAAGVVVPDDEDVICWSALPLVCFTLLGPLLFTFILFTLMMEDLLLFCLAARGDDKDGMLRPKDDDDGILRPEDDDDGAMGHLLPPSTAEAAAVIDDGDGGNLAASTPFVAGVATISIFPSGFFGVPLFVLFIFILSPFSASDSFAPAVAGDSVRLRETPGDSVQPLLLPIVIFEVANVVVVVVVAAADAAATRELRDAIHQLLNIILHLRILVLLLVSTLPYVIKVKNYS
jgi:hypothetical protein